MASAEVTSSSESDSSMSSTEAASSSDCDMSNYRALSVSSTEATSSSSDSQTTSRLKRQKMAGEEKQTEKGKSSQASETTPEGIPRSCIISVQGYKVKNNLAPILEAIFMKHGDIAAECLFKTASVRAFFLELVCEVVRQLQTNDDVTKEIESNVSEIEAANIHVSWLRSHLEAKKKSSLMMETKAKTSMVNKTAKMELKERHIQLKAAKERFEKAERCVKVLDLVEKKLNNNILDSKNEEDSWGLPVNYID